jgi:hypothetical protein
MKSDCSKFSYFKIQELKLSQNMHGRVEVRFLVFIKPISYPQSILSLNKPLNVEMFFCENMNMVC